MIILLGLPKSGTSSFTELFKKTDYCNNVYHWKKNDKYIGEIINNNKINKKPLLSGFKNNDCITQMDVCISNELNFWPQITDFKQIYYENPDSIFILNKRDPNKILKSFKKWFDYQKRFFTYNSEFFESLNDDGFLKFIYKHYNDIESFFKTKPDAKFISFDIDYDNILELKKFINIKDYKTLPKTNVSNTIQTNDANYKILDEYREKYIKYKKKYNDLKALLKSKKIS